MSMRMHVKTAHGAYLFPSSASFLIGAAFVAINGLILGLRSALPLAACIELAADPLSVLIIPLMSKCDPSMLLVLVAGHFQPPEYVASPTDLRILGHTPARGSRSTTLGQ